MKGTWRINLTDGASLVKSGELRFGDGSSVGLWAIFDGELVLAFWAPITSILSIVRSK